MLKPQLNGGPPASFSETTLLAALHRRAASAVPWLTFHSDRRPHTVTASDVLEEARHWCRGFVEAGVAPGACVGLWQPNGPEFVAAFFGAQGAGAIPVPLAWPVLDSQLEVTLERLEPVLTRAGIRVLAAPLGVPTGHRALVRPVASSRDWPAPPGSEDTAFIQFTSGSTGTPRGAVISHRAALHNAHALVAGLKLGPDDVGVSWVPFFHDMGLIGVLLTSLVGGFHIHISRPGGFLLHPWRWLELVGETSATLTVSPDFGYAFAARRCGQRQFSLGSLRCALSGSEPIHTATLDAFDARFGPSGFASDALIGAYGLAENTLGVSAGSARGATLLEANARRLPTVGTPLPGVEIALKPGGQIVVRSPSLMQGYFHDEVQTAAALEDGWLNTGDLGSISDGRLFIIGREKELVIKSGTKFHPSDIEQLIAEHISVPPNGVVAFNDDTDLVVIIEERRHLEPRETLQVRALVVENLGLRIDRIEWVAAGTLPRTTSGKLRRGECAERFRSRT